MFMSPDPWPIVTAVEERELASFGPAKPVTTPGPDTWMARPGSIRRAPRCSAGLVERFERAPRGRESPDADLAACLLGGQADSFGERGEGELDLGELLDVHVGGHGGRDDLDDFSGVVAEYMSAEDAVPAPVGDELAEAVGVAVCHRPQQLVVLDYDDGDVVIAGGQAFGQADRAVFRVGEAAAWHRMVGGLAAGPPDGVPGGQAALDPCRLDQFGSPVDVTGGEDVLDVGAEVVIDGDRLTVAGDPGGVEIEVFEVGGPADRGEDGADIAALNRVAVAEADGELFTAAFDTLDPRIGENLHALVLESSAQCRGDAGIGCRNERGTGFEEPDADPEVGEDGGHLAAGVGSADNRDFARQGFESPDVVVREGKITARDRQQSGTAADGHDDAVPLPAAAILLSHRMRAGEPDRTQLVLKVDSIAAEVAGQVFLVVNIAGHPDAVGQDGIQVRHRGRPFKPESGPGGPLSYQASGAGQSTYQRRPVVPIGSADLLGFQQGDVFAQLPRLQCGSNARGAAAHYQHSHCATSPEGVRPGLHWPTGLSMARAGVSSRNRSRTTGDRKSTRLNSSHVRISYA